MSVYKRYITVMFRGPEYRLSGNQARIGGVCDGAHAHRLNTSDIVNCQP